MIGSDEVALTPTEQLQDALLGFTGCIGQSLEDICSYGLTIGEAYIPFDPDDDSPCDPEEIPCSQAWVRVMHVLPTDVSETFAGSECTSVLSITLEAGVIRCIPIEEEGEAPKESDVLAAAMQSMADMLAIQCAALGCEVWESIILNEWVPHGPLGGQYGGTWTFTVTV